ncbi:MAG: hypothetical protein WC955_03905 [Elusimicrobiota bacterium]
MNLSGAGSEVYTLNSGKRVFSGVMLNSGGFTCVDVLVPVQKIVCEPIGVYTKPVGSIKKRRYRVKSTDITIKFRYFTIICL